LTYLHRRILSRLKRSWLAPVIGGLASSVPFRWVRKPTILDQDQLCLFVTYARDGKIPAHALFHARSWAEAGFKVNLTIILDSLENFVTPSNLDFAAGVLLRANEGYDFGAWAATIAQVPDLKKVSLLCLANDSVYGPFNSFSAMLDRVRKSDADIIGLTESYQITRHFQSYTIFFRQSALCHPTFIKFWRNVRTGGRDFVIQNYELKFLLRMERAGLRALALYPAIERESNPTLMFWRELIMSGFPFLKVQLLRDNPLQVDLTGWDSLVRERGFDPDLVRDHLRIQI
jgi:lipopolysaccharide biosynthesis protein